MEDMALSQFHKEIIINEMAAHWAAKNKLREALLMKIGKVIEKDGDPGKWITLLEQLHKDEPLPEFIKKSLE